MVTQGFEMGNSRNTGSLLIFLLYSISVLPDVCNPSKFMDGAVLRLSVSMISDTPEHADIRWDATDQVGQECSE